MQLGEEEPRHAPVVRLASTFLGVHLIGRGERSSMRNEAAEARIESCVARLPQTFREVGQGLRLIAAGATPAKMPEPQAKPLWRASPPSPMAKLCLALTGHPASMPALPRIALCSRRRANSGRGVPSPRLPAARSLAFRPNKKGHRRRKPYRDLAEAVVAQ